MPRFRASAADLRRTLIGPRVTFSRIVLWAKRLNDWNTMPTSARRSASALPSSGSCWPSMVMVPDSIVSSRLMARHSVDLPEPDGPSDDDDLALADAEVDVAEHVQLAEVLVDSVEHDQRLAEVVRSDRRPGGGIRQIRRIRGRRLVGGRARCCGHGLRLDLGVGDW